VCEQPLDFILDVERQIVFREDRGCRVGDREEGNDIHVAPAGMKIPRATPARQPWWIGLVGGFEGSHRSGSEVVP
jgi:hypothetical protein